jgi:hypothetical protein
MLLFRKTYNRHQLAAKYPMIVRNADNFRVDETPTHCPDAGTESIANFCKNEAGLDWRKTDGWLYTDVDDFGNVTCSLYDE